jgi:hypothetical protein
MNDGSDRGGSFGERAFGHRDPGDARRTRRPDRAAEVLAAAREVRVRAPAARDGGHGDGPREVWAIRVWEPGPPAGAEPLERPLTGREAGAAGRLRAVAGYYECRPVVGEYHKGRKAGVGVEALQPRSRAGLEPLIAPLGVAAAAPVNLRVAARGGRRAGRPAREVIDPLWVRAPSTWRHRAGCDLTAREFTRARARLGGHQDRRCDGRPGWLTLWRGWGRLRTVPDYELSRRTCSKH